MEQLNNILKHNGDLYITKPSMSWSLGWNLPSMDPPLELNNQSPIEVDHDNIAV